MSQPNTAQSVAPSPVPLPDYVQALLDATGYLSDEERAGLV